MSGGMYVNGFDTGLIGVTVTNVVGATAKFAPRTRKVYGRAGLVRTTVVPEVEPRTLTVGVVVRGATPAAMEANLSLLAGLFLADVNVSFETTQDRYLRCVLTTLTIAPHTGPQFVNTTTGAVLSLTAIDPYWQDASVVMNSFNTVAVAMVLGTAPSTPLLRISGAATDPVVTYRDAAGNAKQTLGLTITLAATDYLDIDCDTMTIQKSVSGTVTDALSTLASGDFLVLDPADAPTLEVDSGTGKAFYRRGWL